MISTRHYMFALDGTLKRISDRVFGGLYHGSDAAPDYAGTRQRIATALVRLEDRKPAKILDVHGQFWTFDAAGRVDQDEQLEVLRELTERAYSSPTPKEAKIVSLTPVIKKRKHDARHRWEPTNWFAENPTRNHYVRRPTPIERLQAHCIHGRPAIGHEWFVATRRSDFGLIERRFLSMTAGVAVNFDEPRSQWTFDGALIPGAAPQQALETDPPEAA